ncbi:bifunctional adenosylcobinamide kinase/adenosylcobinamide-phosphate guanylyltransferase [Rhodoferax lacus]|uniref:Bifunctional adenosylcobalamin biosynthesis protein n=1 Tax=Rhodoferax lacus TaxID=2184758 RepID=A0A3E1RH80_9BURK|nr:bifunctional adenosylcobinamide kinase/adenosylcobinamide-phosphate guanylyltransferase [Rhodoferax lacus]RFO98714.1 bifunctional adenosylcobinamide kinase/adenosylcobinamide-phosphate guanylyltransferase [Rhodoferax lacus]
MNAARIDTSGIPSSELILGGQRSGKSRRAEMLARQWLDTSPEHRAVLVATAQPWDAEMRQRIARHQVDRAERVPGMQTVEVPRELGAAIASLSQAQTLVVVDCLTLWLTNWLMPAPSEDGQNTFSEDDGLDLADRVTAPIEALLVSIQQASGPVILVGNEIGMGVIPMGAQVRAFVDTLGRLNQDVARVCARVTLMAAGLPLTLKGTP